MVTFASVEGAAHLLAFFKEVVVDDDDDDAGVVVVVGAFLWLAAICLRLFCTLSSSEMNVFLSSFSNSSSSRSASSAINVSE